MCFDGALIDTETSFQRHLLAGDSCPLGFALHHGRGIPVDLIGRLIRDVQIISRPPPSARDKSYRLISRSRRR